MMQVKSEIYMCLSICPPNIHYILYFIILDIMDNTAVIHSIFPVLKHYCFHCF